MLPDPYRPQGPWLPLGVVTAAAALMIVGTLSDQPVSGGQISSSAFLAAAILFLVSVEIRNHRRAMRRYRARKLAP